MVFCRSINAIFYNGSGSFGAATNFAVGTFPVSVAVGDFNGDGHEDVALAGPNVFSASPMPQSLLYAAFNTNTGGGFGVLTAASFPGSVAGLDARDMNADHQADLQAVQVFPRSNSTSVPDPGDTTFRTYRYVGSNTNSGSNTFAAGVAIALPMTNPAGLSAADFDDDGWIDFAVAGLDARPTLANVAPGGIVAIIPGRPSATALNAVPIFRTGAPALAQTTADLNGDNQPDILIGHATGAAALLNQSRPTLTNSALDSGNSGGLVDLLE